MSVYEYTIKTIDGQEKTLAEYRGKVLLIVNVASHCGLESLYRKYSERGLVVLGFPCNQFAGQEPGDESEIKSFCSLKYDVTFPMFSKVDVNGKDAHPLYEFLKSSQPGLLGVQRIGWNFTKFLVDRNGNVVKRFGALVTPISIEREIENLL
jgi:glutathione peroxidase